MDTPKYRLFVYCRVSTEEQSKEGWSLPEQEQRCRKFITERGHTWAGSFIEKGESGKSFDRPELFKMIQALRDGKADGLVVIKVNRLSRIRFEFEALLRWIQKKEYKFFSLAENVDASTPQGRAMLGVMATFAQLEREDMLEAVDKNQKVLVEDGRVCSRVPFGYKMRYTNSVPKKALRFLVVPEQAKVVQEAFDCFVNKDWTLMATAKWLNFSVPCMRHMLSNPAYIGTYVFKGQIYPDRHEAIITPELFDKAQKKLTLRKYIGGWHKYHLGQMLIKKRNLLFELIEEAN